MTSLEQIGSCQAAVFVFYRIPLPRDARRCGRAWQAIVRAGGFLPILLPGRSERRGPEEENDEGLRRTQGIPLVRGHLRRHRSGHRPGTAKLARSWLGPRRCRAARARLAAERNGRNDETRSLSFGAYLTRRWLPGKQVVLAASTYAGYRRNVERHIVPALGRIALRRLRPHHLEAFYSALLRPGDDSTGLAPKTVYEIHLVIRGALSDAVRRGLVTRNVALVAHAPRMRAIPKVEQRSWTAEELQAFLRAAAGHRLFAALWTGTGMRRNELLGLCWDDWTPPRRLCRSTEGWSPSGTTSMRPAARPPTHVGGSTSTRRLSPYSAPGGHGRPRSCAPSA